jgi:hypothetical protein
VRPPSVFGRIVCVSYGSEETLVSTPALTNRYPLNEVERAGVLRHLISEGDLSGYGLVNAVPHYSHEVEDYDRVNRPGFSGELRI